ncbi:growth factor receptor domain-containing protein [Mycena vulgaris]|nr:growth factor receptor domain-containing protein [Mycena vulgaris]
MLASLFVILFVLGAPVAASNSSIVCVAGQCLQGSSNTTLGVSLSASDVSNSVLLLPGQYTATTNPELIHDLLTSPHATLSPTPGFANSSTLSLPLNVAVAPGLAIYAQTLYSGKAAFSSLPSAPVANASSPLVAESLAMSSSIWVAMSFGANGRVVLWDSVPDTAQLPLRSTGSYVPPRHAVLDLLSLRARSSGTCSAAGTCTCAPGFNGYCLRDLRAGLLRARVQGVPRRLAQSCDEGISGTGRCLTPPVANPLTGVQLPQRRAANGTACAKCASGFFATSTGDCKAAPTGRATALPCGSHFTQDQNDSTKCTTVPTTAAGVPCPDGSFSDGTSCVACSASCSTCAGPTSNDCTLCPNCVTASSTGVCDGSNLIADNNKGKCDTCGAKCTSCEIASFSVASTVNQLKCTGCLKGTVLSGGQCIDSCPTGTFLSPKDNVTCTACDPSCSTCTGSATSCLTCPSGQLAANGKCVATCPSNTFTASGAVPRMPPGLRDVQRARVRTVRELPADSGRSSPVGAASRRVARRSSSIRPSGACQACDASCSSCAGAGPSNCLACAGAGQVLRGGACAAATCTNGTGVVPGLGVCLSDLVVILLMALGCAFIFLLVLMCWRRRARKRRAQQTAAFAAAKRLDRRGGLARAAAALRRAALRAPPREAVENEAIQLMKMRNAEEARHHGEMEKLQLFGAYEYSRAGSTRSHSRSSHAPSHAPSTLPALDDHRAAAAERVSRASMYSEVTGIPRNTPEPRQPISKNLLARYPSSVSSAGRSYMYTAPPAGDARLVDIELPAGPSEAQVYADAIRPALAGVAADARGPTRTGTSSNNPFRR